MLSSTSKRTVALIQRKVILMKEKKMCVVTTHSMKDISVKPVAMSCSRWKGASDIGFVDVESGNEDMLKEVIATVGPVSIAIDASHESFQFYSHGVYHDHECSSGQCQIIFKIIQ